MQRPSVLPSLSRPLIVVVAVVLLVVAACGGTPPVTGPGAVVQEALAKAAAKDLEGLRGLACAGQEDAILGALGVPGEDTAGALSSLLPGVDTQAVIDAVRIDVSKVKIGDATITGDAATVPVTGDVGVTFDAAAMRPILRQVLESQGRTMTDQQLDALLATLQSSGQAVPLDQSVQLVRQDGTWKVCQPAP